MTISPDNRVVQGMWKGRPFSNLERMCIHSFIANGHEFHLYLDGDPGGVPEVEGLKICDLADILPRKKLDRYIGPLAYLSDWFRWELMWQKGGWYVDMDMVCLRPFDFPEPVVFGYYGYLECNSCTIKFPAHHFLAQHLSENTEHPDRDYPWDDEGDKSLRRSKRRARWQFWRHPATLAPWGAAGGPIGFTNALKHFGMLDMAQPRSVFFPNHMFPFDYVHTELLHELGLLEPLLRHSHGAHLMQSGFKRVRLDPNDVYPHNSLYETLKRRYLPAG